MKGEDKVDGLLADLMKLRPKPSLPDALGMQCPPTLTACETPLEGGHPGYLGQDKWGRINGAGYLGQDKWGRISGAG